VSKNVEKRFTDPDGHKRRCDINPNNRRSFPDEESQVGVPSAWLLESVLHCFSRAHQFTFQCNRRTCKTRHKEMFLYKLRSGENRETALDEVVNHVKREFKMDGWIQALHILEPLKQFYEQLVVQ